MGIWASVEIGKGRFELDDNGDTFTSKAVASFIIGPLPHICPTGAALLDNYPNDDWKKSIQTWFSKVLPKMSHDICLLHEADYGYWPYKEDDYEGYLAAPFSFSPTNPVMSYDEFKQVFRELEQKWTDIQALKACVDDLIRVLEEVRPEDNWFYEEEHSLPDFRIFSRVLERAYRGGHERVRILCV